LILSGGLFAIVALAHLCRLVFAWRIVVDDALIPMWVSWVGLVIPGALALWAFLLSRRGDQDA
jgi:hypothetical protein